MLRNTTSTLAAVLVAIAAVAAIHTPSSLASAGDGEQHHVPLLCLPDYTVPSGLLVYVDGGERAEDAHICAPEDAYEVLQAITPHAGLAVYWSGDYFNYPLYTPWRDNITFSYASWVFEDHHSAQLESLEEMRAHMGADPYVPLLCLPDYTVPSGLLVYVDGGERAEDAHICAPEDAYEVLQAITPHAGLAVYWSGDYFNYPLYTPWRDNVRVAHVTD